MSVLTASFADFETDAIAGTWFAFTGRLWELSITADAALPNTLKVNDGSTWAIFANETRIWDRWPEHRCEYIIRIGGINTPQRVMIIYEP